MKTQPMRKLARTQLRAWVVQQLAKQGGSCLLCREQVDLSIPRQAVADHNHKTGELRGVLCRSCNSGEGKTANAAGRWGAKSMDYDKIIPWLKNLVEYLESPGLGLMYPTHRTPEELRLAKNAKARKARANTAATKIVRKSVRSMAPKKESK